MRRQRKGVLMLICGPFHSVCNPPVGMAYLKSYLETAGIGCKLFDLNIQSRECLKEIHIDANLIDRLYSQSCRTYIAEAMVWSWHDPDGAKAIIQRTQASESTALLEFWQDERLSDLINDPKLIRVSRLLQKWINAQVNHLALQAQGWVGFSTTITNIAANLYMARQFKKHNPDLLIVMGGPEITHRNAPEILQSFPYVDAVIPPPAYAPFAALLTDVPAAGNGNIPEGVWYRHPNGRITPAKRPPEPDLEKLPYADWSDLDLTAYDPGFIVRDTKSVAPYYPVIPLHTSQGCSYNLCNFCYNISLYPHFSSQSPQRVISEIKHQIEDVKSYGFFFTDFEFNGSIDRVMEICRLIRETLDHPIRFYAWLRIDKLNRTLLKAIHSAGCQQVFIGLEAVDDDLLRLMNKGYTADMALKKLKMLNDFQSEHPYFHYEFNLITHYPGETLESVKNTLATVMENYSLFYRKVSAAVPFMLHEGTPAHAGINGSATGCMTPIFPSGTTLRSYRYVIDLPFDPTLADRDELWSAVTAVAHRKS